MCWKVATKRNQTGEGRCGYCNCLYFFPSRPTLIERLLKLLRIIEPVEPPNVSVCELGGRIDYLSKLLKEGHYADT